MKFTDKNDFIVKNRDAKHFDKDRELFTKHFPDHRLHADLKRANQWTRNKLDGMMLFILLDKITPEEIIENREIEEKQTISEEKLNEMLSENGIEMEELPVGAFKMLLTFTEEEVLEAIKKEVASQETNDDEEEDEVEILPAEETVTKPTETVTESTEIVTEEKK